MMRTIYLFSGLGADRRAFQYLDLPHEFHKVHVEWIPPLEEETMEAYAVRIRRLIREKEPILIGLSYGGMIAVEIAKQLPEARLILISSAKTGSALGVMHTFVFRWKLYRLLPGFLLRRSGLVANYMFGARSDKVKRMLAAILADTDVHFFRWALDSIAGWQNETLPRHCIHIHGTADKIIPYAGVQADYVIEGGGHLMIVDHADEISRIIKDFLKRQ